MNMKRFTSFVTAFLMTATTFAASGSVFAEETTSYESKVTVNFSDKGKAISPYIFGINEHGLDSSVTVNSVRQGGNRYSGYNWETNASNAGEDWYNSSDNHLSSKSTPADCVQTLSKEATKGNISYKLATVQMCGYVSADKNGEVSEEEAAPSARWNKVVAAKGSDLSLTPDLEDGVVYMDEYVNYTVNKLGDASSETGIQGWSLDNEPGLWNDTHPRMHSEQVTCEELITKSVETAKAVKSVDPKAEIFGPALFGYMAYVQLDSEDDWKTVNSDGKYDWFISYYLDQMKKAEEESGQRLLDVMDIHYYTEAQGTCGTRMCSDPTHTACIDEMTQSYRTLIEKGYTENSWIGQWCQQNIPILTTVKNSIDKYYPGTKLAISEYDFGGGTTIAGAIAEVDALGTFADNEVYYATLWADDVPYQYSAINMFTNYDGEGSSFGNTLLESKTDDYVKSTSYAAINGDDQGEVTLIITNKDQTKSENANIDLSGSKADYKNAAVYVLSGETSEIIHKISLDKIDGNKFTVEVPPLSIVEVVVSDDENDYRPVVEKNVPEYENKAGTVKAAADAGNYTISFDEKLNGNKLVLDIDLDNSPSASGCIDTNVEYKGVPYWVEYDWTIKSSGELEVDLMKPSKATDVSTKEGVATDDEEILAGVAELIKNQTSLTFQTWYVADDAWIDTDHSKVTVKSAALKKEVVATVVETEGTVKAATDAGNYAISFDKALNGGQLVLDVNIGSSPMASGCVDTNVEYKGVPYWVEYDWSVKSSGSILIDLSKPSKALDVSSKDNESTDDEELLAALAELIKSQTSLTFQTWYAADDAWKDTDHSGVVLNSAVLRETVKGSETGTPADKEPDVTTSENPSTVKERQYGDINNDNKIDLNDLTALSLYLVGSKTLDEEAIRVADVTGDGQVLLNDLPHLKQYIVHDPVVLGPVNK